MVSVVVRGRIPGRTGPGDTRLGIAPQPTVRELICAVVASQLAGCAAADAAVTVWRDYSRLYLTDDEIAAMAAQGRVGRDTRRGAAQHALPSAASATEQALAAYQRGVFAVFAGASQAGGLDDALALRDGDRVVFLRLTALVGG